MRSAEEVFACRPLREIDLDEVSMLAGVLKQVAATSRTPTS